MLSLACRYGIGPFPGFENVERPSLAFGAEDLAGFLEPCRMAFLEDLLELAGRAGFAGQGVDLESLQDGVGSFTDRQGMFDRFDGLAVFA